MTPGLLEVWGGSAAASMGSLHAPQVRGAWAREPRQDREGSSAKRWSASLRVAWGTSFWGTSF